MLIMFASKCHWELVEIAIGTRFALRAYFFAIPAAAARLASAFSQKTNISASLTSLMAETDMQFWAKRRGNVPAACLARMMAAWSSLVRWNSVPDSCSHARRC
jgi:hypothetical protein